MHMSSMDHLILVLLSMVVAFCPVSFRCVSSLPVRSPNGSMSG